MGKDKIIFLDWGIFLHRAIFASLNNPKIPSTYTALNMILSCLRRIGIEPDDRVIIAVDGGKSWRKDVDSSYKANRKEAREKFDIDWNREYNNFNLLLDELCEATDWNIVEVEGVEADDIMAVGSRYFKDNEVVLVTYDSDLEQMWAYDNVKIFSPIKKCAGKAGKGAYKIPPKNFNVYKLLSKKIEKETADNLVNPILTQEDYEKRKQIVNLLELPENIENTIKERLSNLEDKDIHTELLPFKRTMKEKFVNIYNRDKVVTYADSMKKRRKRRKKK